MNTSRVTSASHRQGSLVQSAMQLIALDFPRSPVIWIVVPLIVAFWVLGRDAQPEGLVLWTVASATIGMVSVTISPVVAGFFAWLGQSAYRANAEPLLRSQPSSGTLHMISVLTTGMIWIVLIVAVFIVYQVYLLFRYSTFGSLEFPPIAMGISVLIAAGAVGYSIGVVNSKVWAPLLAAAVFALLQLGLPIVMSTSPLRYLSGVPFLGSRSGGVLMSYWPAVDWAFVAWMVGVGGIAVALAMLSREGVWILYGAVLFFGLIALLGAGRLVTLSADFYAIPREPISWEPECEATDTLDLVVCVHPAYISNLAPTVKIASAVWEPVAGFDGIPRSIEQFPVDSTSVSPVPIYFESNGRNYLSLEYATLATNGIESAPQALVALWLASQAVPVSDELVLNIAARFRVGSGGGDSDGTTGVLHIREQLLQHLESFDSLSPNVRRAWLDENWDSLRAGELELADMPVS